MAGCSSAKPERQHQETQECMTYRSMMTAPMAPDAMERLRVGCEGSNEKLDRKAPNIWCRDTQSGFESVSAVFLYLKFLLEKA
ncbi:hypothetical protein C1S65_16465 [Pseudomonas putida]|uniref:Uncharacterized protein n=1 Tax=Pseudomonas putida TaxID=303 RepID=A0AAD0LBH7_PSEPU|nr:hypothetical protein C1S65_16465 [Pseudomonas putida]